MVENVRQEQLTATKPTDVETIVSAIKIQVTYLLYENKNVAYLNKSNLHNIQMQRFTELQLR